MFGMGFMEILFVLVIAIIALGPEKLPNTVVEVAKFFKKFKSGLDDAKSTIDNELKISEMKQQAEDFKASVGDVTSMARIDLDGLNDNNLDIDDYDYDDEPKVKKKKPQVDKTKSKKEKVSLNKEED